MSDLPNFPLKTIPVKHIPYLEKHRIHELFKELARELVVQKPLDHVMFIKQILSSAANLRDTARILILPSPKINTLEIATEISKITNQVVVSEYTLLRTLQTDTRESVFPKELAKTLRNLIRTENAYKNGWIIVGCIQTDSEARAILREGILPTLVIHFVASFHPRLDQLLYCNVHAYWPEFRRKIYNLREVFSTSLKEVHIKQKSMEDIVNECINISKCFRGPKFIKPRIILIGPRGSGRRTQAQLISSKLGVVHVDFQYLLCQVWTSESDLGQKLRECKNEACFHPELLVQVLNKRILEDDCLESGWILTGYPFTATDLKFIDSLDTPPSRIIFLDIDINICMERLRYRWHNIYTGSITNVKEDSKAFIEKELRLHPKNEESLITAELYYYCENYGAMKKYCGNTAFIINADQDSLSVFNCILSAITKALPPGITRSGLIEKLPNITDSCICIPVPDHVMNCFIHKR
ncbi:adenylate kinase 8 [Aethina tumida]|uniref:adenylate kinase 8 n=1 Tax=Aethina tumida TaxID=116153 RepID=UPI00096AE87F|nr:adenylate kinase 8 [Aethina tumida]